MSVEWDGGRRYVFIESKARTSERIQARKGKKKSRNGCGHSGGCILFILYWDGSLIFDVGVCVGQVIIVVSGVGGVGCVEECNGMEEFLSGV